MCLTIGAPGQLESIFHSTECKSEERTAAVTAAYAELFDKDQATAGLKRELKNIAKSGDLYARSLLTSPESRRMHGSLASSLAPLSLPLCVCLSSSPDEYDSPQRT